MIDERPFTLPELVDRFETQFRQGGNGSPSYAVALAIMHSVREQQAHRMAIERLTGLLDEQLGQLISATRGR